MKIILSDQIQIWKKYNALVNINSNNERNIYFLNNADLINFKVSHYNPTKVKIKEMIYNVIPASNLPREKNNKDNYYRLLYLQVNLKTKEYYIGVTKTRKLAEIKHLDTTEVRLECKHPAYQGEYVRFYILSCTNDRQLEESGKAIIDAQLLSDKLCLNSKKDADAIMTASKYWKVLTSQEPTDGFDALGTFFTEENQEAIQEKPIKKPAQAAPVTRKQTTSSKPAKGKTTAKEIDMLDLETGKVIKHFASQKDAGTWLVQEGKAKSMSCTSSISAVCRGAGNRKQAYGYKWAYTEAAK